MSEYTEEQVHEEGVVAIILDNIPDIYILNNTRIEEAEHPTSVLVLVDTDDRMFKVTVTTEEVKE
jgi:hypothetical protein